MAYLMTAFMFSSGSLVLEIRNGRADARTWGWISFEFYFFQNGLHNSDIL